MRGQVAIVDSVGSARRKYFSTKSYERDPVAQDQRRRGSYMVAIRDFEAADISLTD